jgi:tRNA (cytidine/uridine-2'-O-)-methyltransferase
MLNIVLYQPEIAENVGNIIRTCVAFDATLHLIRPYGFLFNKNDPKIKRSCANYIEHLTIVEHDTYEQFLSSIKDDYSIFYITRYGIKNPSDVKFKTNKNVYIMFGKESTGIDKQILIDNKQNTIRIPSSDKVRSINVSNCVAIVAYEFIKQNNYEGLKDTEPFKPLFE